MLATSMNCYSKFQTKKKIFLVPPSRRSCNAAASPTAGAPSPGVGRTACTPHDPGDTPGYSCATHGQWSTASEELQPPASETPANTAGTGRDSHASPGAGAAATVCSA